MCRQMSVEMGIGNATHFGGKWLLHERYAHVINKAFNFRNHSGISRSKNSASFWMTLNSVIAEKLKTKEPIEITLSK